MAEAWKDGAWETATEPEDIAGGYRGGGGECVGEEQFVLQGERAGGGGEGCGWGVGGREAEDERAVARGVRGMSDTPETDNERTLKLALEVFTELAKTLKQERDEAREKYATEATEHMLAVNKLCGERDEALEKLNPLRQSLRDSQDEVLRLTLENRIF